MPRRLRPLYGRTAAISCGHPAAAAAGWEALAAGGSVADAAIAAAAVLTVTLPSAVTIGGDGFILLHDAAARRTFGLNASGRAPALTDVAAFAGGIPERGPRSCTVPALVAGWEALHRRFGRLDWAPLFRRAIDLATGFPASPGIAAATVANRAVLAEDPGATQLFLKPAPATGAIFRQPALAATLRTIAEGGADAFYRGAPAASVARYVQSRGGWLSAQDLADCSVEWVEPLRVPYRGLEVAVMPPNSFGLFMLLQLAALDTADLRAAAVDSPERYAALIAAARAAFALGDTYVADPDVVGRAPPAILSETGLAELRRAFRSANAPAPANAGGTAVISIADAEGNAACVVQSVFLGYGSGVADPETGILLNNRMFGFTNAPDHPNVVAPRKRPAHTLNPAMALEGGEIRYVLATPGGPGQTLTLTQVLQAMVEHRLPLHEAMALPRWSMDLSGSVILEPGLPQATFDALRRRDHKVTWGAAGSPFFGSAECVERLPGGGLLAVADHRRDGHAIAL
ncbi:MAG TPA: gamma-glutamyltransferase [Xanthobacteraceae bacterium]